MALVELLRWWREAGGKAVSFGSDAHQPWRVAGKFRLAADIAQAAGFAPGLVMPADEPGRGRRLDLTGLAIAVPAVSG